MESKGTALITGGAKRIGEAITLHLAERGYDIALHFHTSAPRVYTIGEQIRKKGRKCFLFPCDFSKMEDVSNLIPRVFAQCPSCNVLVNNASIFESADFLETEEDFFDRHFQINFKVPFFLTQAFARHCEYGHVINIIDTKAFRTVTKYFAYTLTKKALYELTKMAAKELAPGIRVNGVAPGVILPPPGEDESYLDERSLELPLQCHGDTRDIAEAVSFLIENSFITGHCILVDGGEHLF